MRTKWDMARLREIWTALVRAGAAVVGVQEVLVTIALLLIARGFMEFWAPGAWLVPGVVMLWLFLPQRARFVAPRPMARKES